MTRQKVYGLWWGGSSYGHPFPDQYEEFPSVSAAGQALVDRYHNRLVPATPNVGDECLMDVYIGEPPDGRRMMDCRLTLRRGGNSWKKENC